MQAATMLERIQSVVATMNRLAHRPTTMLKVQIFSYFSAMPFEFSNELTDALISCLKGRNEMTAVSFQFDFLQENHNSSRLLRELSNDIATLHIIGTEKSCFSDYLATKGIALRHLQVTIRASESSIQPLCQALKQNTSLESMTICSYHPQYPSNELFGSIENHCTLIKLQLMASEETLLDAMLSNRLSSGLEELQLSALCDGSLSLNTTPYSWRSFLCNLENMNQLRRLGLYSLRNLSTQDVDEMLCHLSPSSRMQHLDLYGNPSAQSLYFPNFYHTQKELQHLRQINIGPSLEALEADDEEESIPKYDYLYTLLSKHPSLYQIGTNLEKVLASLDMSCLQQDKLFLLADWNRSRMTKLLPLLHKLPHGLWARVLERSQIAVNKKRQASVLKMMLQETASQLLLVS